MLQSGLPGESGQAAYWIRIVRTAIRPPHYAGDSALVDIKNVLTATRSIAYELTMALRPP